jgi:hypothetical protein
MSCHVCSFSDDRRLHAVYRQPPAVLRARDGVGLLALRPASGKSPFIILDPGLIGENIYKMFLEIGPRFTRQIF